MMDDASAVTDTARTGALRALAGASAEGAPIRLKAKLFRGFADPSRLAIVEALREGPRTVTEIVELTGLSQPNASNHLACLLDCGLVHREQRGRFAVYRLASARVEDLLGGADDILEHVATGAEACRRYELTDSDGTP